MRFAPSLLLGGALLARGLSCNGRAELCDRKYSNITMVGTHDSPFVGFLPVDNQNESVEKQLGHGVRYLQAQTHDKDGAVQLCHTNCLLKDAGTLQEYLGTIRTFLDGSPDEVVTILLTNPDNIDVAKFGDAFRETGLDALAFAPAADLKLNDWPTLGAMIADKKRLVVFMDFHADPAKVPFILDEFKYYAETPFDTTDKDFPQCNIDRPPKAPIDGRMLIMNHFLDVELLPGVLIPDVARADQTNSVSSILAQSDLCFGNFQRMPNVVLVDFASRGDVMKAQDALNNF